MKRTQHIAYFKVPYEQKDKNNDNFCCGNKKSSKGDGVTDNEDPELNQFYYHSDHLGSSSYITNLNGSIVQHIEYVPFGEVFLEEKNNKWNTPYLFNGKELDEETGLYYYGARYYDSRSSLWLSVDPLAEKYPSISPYAYVANNPINAIDPDGRDPILFWKVTGYIMEKLGTNSNIRTIGYTMNHPINAMRTGSVNIPTWGISKIASNFEVNLRIEASFTSGEGKQGNAYRHVLWQSILTEKFGIDQAKRIGNAHENSLPSNINQRNFENMDAADQMADLLNNNIGREIV